jgi:hypothetical protein
MDSDAITWFFILIALGTGVVYVVLVLNQQDQPQEPPPTQPISQNRLYSPAVSPTTIQGEMQTWQCFTNAQGKQQCSNVFNNQGLPYTSYDRTQIQQKMTHAPVWQCTPSGCTDIYNFIGKAF